MGRHRLWNNCCRPDFVFRICPFVCQNLPKDLPTRQTTATDGITRLATPWQPRLWNSMDPCMGIWARILISPRLSKGYTCWKTILWRKSLPVCFTSLQILLKWNIIYSGGPSSCRSRHPDLLGLPLHGTLMPSSSSIMPALIPRALGC